MAKKRYKGKKKPSTALKKRPTVDKRREVQKEKRKEVAKTIAATAGALGGALVWRIVKKVLMGVACVLILIVGAKLIYARATGTTYQFGPLK